MNRGEIALMKLAVDSILAAECSESYLRVEAGERRPIADKGHNSSHRAVMDVTGSY